jgi:hypothetical protein
MTLISAARWHSRLYVEYKTKVSSLARRQGLKSLEPQIYLSLTLNIKYYIGYEQVTNRGPPILNRLVVYHQILMTRPCTSFISGLSKAGYSYPGAGRFIYY